jgi:WhiB family redox-sensing transcriptional regulator
MAPGIGEELPSLEDLAHRPAWMARAACRGLPLDLFFPVRGVSAATMGRVRAVCAGCSVRSECLDYAAATVETMGVWGGTTDRERRKHRVVA